MPFSLTFIANHLWQSTLVAAAIAALCFALRKNTARTRYWLWLAASLKFLVPFSMLVSLGSSVNSPGDLPTIPAVTVEQISTSFSPVPIAITRPQAAAPQWPFVLAAIWAAGSLLLLLRWLLRWRSVYAIKRAAHELPLSQAIPVLSSNTTMEPGIFGIIRPVLLLPQDIWNKLTPTQFDTIVAHELCHLRYRDNLTAAIHMVIEVLFWFHPAVWWIGSKLVEERERACDESVLAQGRQPEVYATGILNVCKFYLASPLPCAPGVTGADLKRRISEIMTRRTFRRLTVAHKMMLAVAGGCIACTPLVIGILRAQTLPPAPEYTYDVVSIRPSAPGQVNTRIGPGPQGGIKTENTSAMQLMITAYDVREFQLVDVPEWMRTARYDVTFTPDKAEVTPDPGMPRDQMEGLFNRQKQRMQAVLRDRFGLVLRAESREMSMYALTVARDGHKLAQPAEGARGPHMMMGRGQLTGVRVYMNMLTNSLSTLLGRHVSNETGLDGPFDLKLEWTPDSSMPLPGGPPPGAPEPASTTDAGVSIFTALTEQLGLKLESKKGRVPVFVIEKIEKPSEN
jgi:bla regulator protein blaR1